ncbi:DUF262 domain-containing protein [Pseudoalteromonas sp. SWYJZ98]|uniref:DUF262 domain-containing protein n=1 Tax=Pseudoalteromonas sp. SWYJZ98 TaxID=2792060 RepID=UPI0018CF90E1|nr:DUF262 domain-containing protein [Pseudoalteromonas sp. SWYJZ98]MBH0029516.1 DUF262 domain-containing protein [Pseudoalteromonas sp. SWYJZ98]
MDIQLFDNEKIDFDKNGHGGIEDLDKSAANEKYIKGAVRIVTEQARYPLNTILAMVKSDDYKLNPEFQRRHRWGIERKSKLIESFIMNVPIPPIFLYEVNFSEYEVMDGLQRLTAISQFYANEFQLAGLSEWPELNGCTYSSLPEQIQKGIDRRYISSIILLQETAKSTEEANRLKQLVFERINSGGEKLKPQEIRNALYPGVVNSMCISLARNEYFCRLWNIPVPDAEELETGTTDRNEVISNELYKDMSDVELCLRFFAYRQLDNWKGNTMEVFFDEFQKEGNVIFTPEVIEKQKRLFEETIKLSWDIYGEKAFWLHRHREGKWFHYERPTKLLYDPIMHVLSTMLDKKDELIANKGEILAATEQFHKDIYEQMKGRDTNKNAVNTRFKIFSDFFNQFVS